jgi:hypothetical protein
MNRRVFGLLLVAAVAFPLLASRSHASIAPRQGSVFVKTLTEDGGVAPYVSIGIEKLQGSYAVPPGPYVTNAYGQIWIGLYPGVYRFTVTDGESQPTFWDVTVNSRGEYYIRFYVSILM